METDEVSLNHLEPEAKQAQSRNLVYTLKGWHIAKKNLLRSDCP